MHVVRVLEAGAVATLDRVPLLRKRLLVGRVSLMIKRWMTTTMGVALLWERLLPWKRVPRPVSNHG